MNAVEFLKTKGEAAQPKVRFRNAGVPTLISLVDLLEEYAALSVSSGDIKNSPAKAPKSGSSKSKKQKS